MISVSLGDILKAFDEFKDWPRMVAAPKRLDALEARIAALEAELRTRPKAEACALCGGAMKVISEKPHPTFGTFGVRERTLKCDGCSHVITTRFDPEKRG